MAQDADTVGTSYLESLLLCMDTVEYHLQEAAWRSAQQVGHGVACSVTLRQEGRPVQSQSTQEGAARCDAVGIDVTAGPALAAMDGLTVVDVPRVEEEDRWPAWREATLAAGYRSFLAVPVCLDRRTDVALGFYAPAPTVWDVRALLRADATAQQTARVLALWLRVSDLTRELGRTDSELVTAAVTRDVVEQAVGALMALHHCTAEEASAHLEAEADRTGSDVADVAAALLDGLSDPR